MKEGAWSHRQCAARLAQDTKPAPTQVAPIQLAESFTDNGLAYAEEQHAV